ncbi:MAG TPA: aminotransferase class V-fold PLP-dependent enzyme, partial [Gemmatimonadaceae bacterium]|nr:aminotransferase class V-fold PLP-dependent enzyme [Gemmatimonadaceae bacterium]
MTAAVRVQAPRDAAYESFESIRATEFARLDAQDVVYLDYTGAALPSESQICAHDQLLRGSLLGNPHSEHAPSRAATVWIEEARDRLLRFLDAYPDEYEVIFTANASAAIKLVAESYGFGPRAGLVIAADNHNSVNGVREYARRAGAPT